MLTVTSDFIMRLRADFKLGATGLDEFFQRAETSPWNRAPHLLDFQN